MPVIRFMKYKMQEPQNNIFVIIGVFLMVSLVS